MATSTRPLRAAIYPRISKADNEDSHGVERQITVGRRKAVEWGMDVVACEELSDNDQSGTNADRPGFTRLQELVGSGGIDVVVVQDTDRIGRDELLELLFWELCRDNNVQVYTWTGPYDFTSEGGRMMSAVKAVMNASYARSVKSKTRDALEQRAMEGKLPSGSIPYGFRRAGDWYEVDPVTAPHVRRMAQLVLDGVGLVRIASILDEEQAPTGAAQWRASRVKTILQNPRIAGYRVYRDNIIGEGPHAPIIDPERWDAVHAALKSRRRGRGDHSKRLKHYLSGALTCAECGGAMYHNSVGGGAKPRGVYQCRRVDHGCGLAVTDHHVEPLVAERVREWTQMHAPALQRDTTHLQDQLRSLTNESRLLDVEERELGAMFGRREVARSTFVEAAAGLRAERDRLHTEMSRVEAQVDGSRSAQAPLMHLVADADTWDAMPADDKRRVVRWLFPVIYVDPAEQTGAFDPERIKFVPYSDAVAS